MCDADQQVRLKLGFRDGAGPLLDLVGEDGKIRASLRLSEVKGPLLDLLDRGRQAPGKPLPARRSQTAPGVLDEAGMERMTLYVAEDGTPIVEINDRQGEPVVQMEAPASPDSAAVRITDAAGITHSFPSQRRRPFYQGPKLGGNRGRNEFSPYCVTARPCQPIGAT